MSSSSSYRPSHLHRVNLQSNGKRPFEEYGYDSDPDPSSLNSGTQPSLPHSTFTEGIPETPSVSSEDNLRSSLQRFNEFERHIAALRSSIATSRRSLLPQMGSSEHATHEDWHAGPSTFQSMNSGGFTARDTSDESNGKDDTFSSMSSFGSTNGISTTHLSAPSTGSRLYPFQYNNLSPPYSPMSGGPSAEGERSGGTIGSSHVLPGMEGTRANVGIRRPSDSRLSPPPPPPQLHPTRGSPSPLVLESAVSPSSSDDTSLASNGVIGSDLRLPVTCGRRDNISPAGFFERQAGELSHQFGTGDDHLTTDHLIDAESQVERASPKLAEIRHRVLRQHSVERGPTPSIFDGFQIGDLLFEHDVTRRSQSPARDRAAVSVVPHSLQPELPSFECVDEHQTLYPPVLAQVFVHTSIDLPGYTSDDSHSGGQPLGEEATRTRINTPMTQCEVHLNYLDLQHWVITQPSRYTLKDKSNILYCEANALYWAKVLLQMTYQFIDSAIEGAKVLPPFEIPHLRFVDAGLLFTYSDTLLAPAEGTGQPVKSRGTVNIAYLVEEFILGCWFHEVHPQR
ncbi:hypothetical protein EDD15DRAFT_2530894 [Pisolithus albus]|nr:hypothetical protein EDD15DRAFT_2530894 [Pisolithus albus]